MKQMTIVALVMLMATPVLAFFDSTPNTIGIYLDADAEEVCVQGLVEGNTEFTFYMIITNPTFSTMEGFVAGYTFDGVAGVNSAVLADPNAIDDGFLGEHIVHFDSPMPTSDSNLLMTLSATYQDFEYGSARLRLHNIPLNKSLNAPFVFLSGGESLDLNLSYEEGITIRINADCGSVATEKQSMGGIKSLYR